MAQLIKFFSLIVMKKWDILYAVFYYLAFGLLIFAIAVFTINAIDQCWIQSRPFLTLTFEIITIGLMILNFYLLFRFSKKWLGIYPNVEEIHWQKIFVYVFYEFCIWFVYMVFIFLAALSKLEGGLWN